MNQKQRDFLTKKIEAKADSLKRKLEDDKNDAPDLGYYMSVEAVKGKVKLLPIAEINQNIKLKGKNAFSSDEDWRTGKIEVAIKLDVIDIFELPRDYIKAVEIYEKKEKERKGKLQELENITNGLITRINLASDKVLEKLIAEVDDLGNISLTDQHLRILLGTSSSLDLDQNKQLTNKK